MGSVYRSGMAPGDRGARFGGRLWREVWLLAGGDFHGKPRGPGSGRKCSGMPGPPPGLGLTLRALFRAAGSGDRIPTRNRFGGIAADDGGTAARMARSERRPAVRALFGKSGTGWGRMRGMGGPVFARGAHPRSYRVYRRPLGSGGVHRGIARAGSLRVGGKVASAAGPGRKCRSVSVRGRSGKARCRRSAGCRRRQNRSADRWARRRAQSIAQFGELHRQLGSRALSGEADGDGGCPALGQSRIGDRGGIGTGMRNRPGPGRSRRGGGFLRYRRRGSRGGRRVLGRSAACVRAAHGRHQRGVGSRRLRSRDSPLGRRGRGSVRRRHRASLRTSGPPGGQVAPRSGDQSHRLFPGSARGGADHARARRRGKHGHGFLEKRIGSFQGKLRI